MSNSSKAALTDEILNLLFSEQKAYCNKLIANICENQQHFYTYKPGFTFKGKQYILDPTIFALTPKEVLELQNPERYKEELITLQSLAEDVAYGTSEIQKYMTYILNSNPGLHLFIDCFPSCYKDKVEKLFKWYKDWTPSGFPFIPLESKYVVKNKKLIEECFSKELLFANL